MIISSPHAGRGTAYTLPPADYLMSTLLEGDSWDSVKVYDNKH